MADPGPRWDGDLNAAVVAEWTDETTPFERVQAVLLTTTTPRYAGEIADRARVSEPSARKHLGTLAAAGFAETEDAGRGTRFKRSRATVATRRIAELHAELTRAELVDGIRELEARIEEFREAFDATDPDGHVLELDADDDGWAAASEWRAVEADLNLARAALSLYDFDPDRDGETPPGASSRGAFADGTSDLS